MKPKVSVVIPTYMREVHYLSRSINSLLNQSYSNIEIIIVDDNPPNSIFRKNIDQLISKKYNYSNILYLKNKKNMGGSLARNEGINRASGEYITFLDDDDEYLPEKVEKQIDFMVENDCDMSFTNFKFVNENKVVLDYREYRNIPAFDKVSLLKYHLMRHLTGTPTFMYKTKKLKEIGGFEEANMGQEFYLMLKSIEKGLKIQYLKTSDLLAYRHKDGGISFGKNKIAGEKALFAFKKNYYYLFSTREKMFIRFRHNAVLAVAYKRNRQYLNMLLSCVAMFIVSPLDFIKEGTNFSRNFLEFSIERIKS